MFKVLEHRLYDCPFQAVKIDNTEVNVWFKIGQTAMKIEDFQLAQLAFEEGLVCSPKHWPCLDNLITLLYALNNYWREYLELSNCTSQRFAGLYVNK